MKKTNTASIARRMATQFWGEVQRQQKVGEGIWWFTTAGHGGFVVDTDVRPKLKEFNSKVYYGSGQRYYRYEEQHFAAFEEDCEAAKVEWAYPEIMDKTSQWFSFTCSQDEWVQERIKCLRTSLSRWNPDWLARHPIPGWQEPQEVGAG